MERAMQVPFLQTAGTLNFFQPARTFDCSGELFPSNIVYCKMLVKDNISILEKLLALKG